MSVATYVRQSESSYRYEEYMRRTREEREAWIEYEGLTRVKGEAQRKAVEFRMLALSLGVGPFSGGAGVMERHLWDLREAAVREQEYAAAVWKSRASAVRSAWARYLEV